MTTMYICILLDKSPMLKSLLFLSADNIWEKALRLPMLLRKLQEQLQKAAKDSSSKACMSDFSLAKMLSVCKSPQGTSEEQKPRKISASLHSVVLSPVLLSHGGRGRSDAGSGLGLRGTFFCSPDSSKPLRGGCKDQPLTSAPVCRTLTIPLHKWTT